MIGHDIINLVYKNTMSMLMSVGACTQLSHASII